MSLDKNKWEELLAKSNAGNSEAQNNLAMWFEEGYNDTNFRIEKDLNKAAYWYLESAQSGNQYSQDATSRLYSLGQGVELNVEKAIKWAMKSIEQGNAIAAYNLGTVFRDQLKLEKAFEYYSLALKMGDKSALLQIGLCCYFGVGTNMDYVKANQLFDQLIKEAQVTESEIDEAHYWIGLSFLNGNGRIQSIEAAREYLHKANRDEDHEPSMLILNIISRNNDNTR